MKLIQGDCIVEIDQIEDHSVDLILTDPPYGVTAIDWDSVISFDDLWKQYKRILKDSGTIIITAVQPFTSRLILSNEEMFKYTIIWEKTTSCSFFQAKNRPLQSHEDICVFSKGQVGHEVQPELRQMVFERDNWVCQKCGSTENLHCHHETGVELNPIESADIDNCYTFCKDCHKYIHSQEDCKYSDFRRKACIEIEARKISKE